MRLAALAMLPLMLLLSAVVEAGSTYRCGSRLVSLDASTSEVLGKCGEPQGRSLTGYKEIVDDYGVHQEVAVEEWVYGPTHGMYHYLRFEGGRLRNIDSQRGQ